MKVKTVERNKTDRKNGVKKYRIVTKQKQSIVSQSQQNSLAALPSYIPQNNIASKSSKRITIKKRINLVMNKYL